MGWCFSFNQVGTGRGYSALQVAFLRIGFGAITLAPFAYVHFKHIEKKILPWVVFAGFLGSLLPAYLFATAEEHISSGIAGILSSLTPLFTIIIGALFYKQKVKQSEVSGLLLAFSGAIMLILTGSRSLSEFSVLHAILIVLACICYAANINIIKYKLSHVPSMAIASGSLVGVGLVSCMALFFTGFHEQVQTQAGQKALVYLFILGSTATGIALVMFNKLLKVATPLFASSVTYMIPVIAVILGVYIREEEITFLQIICLTLILFGIFLIKK